jgi:hypothetical protein
MVEKFTERYPAFSFGISAVAFATVFTFVAAPIYWVLSKWWNLFFP